MKNIKNANKHIIGIDFYGNEVQYDYDKYGNLIHIKDSTGPEEWKEYNENGDLIHIKDSTGYEEWWDYDEFNTLIYTKSYNICSDFIGTTECWYDDKGNEIHELIINDSGKKENEIWRVYDDFEKLFLMIDKNGNHYYDDDSYIICITDFDEYITYCDYKRFFKYRIKNIIKSIKRKINNFSIIYHNYE